METLDEKLNENLIHKDEIKSIDINKNKTINKNINANNNYERKNNNKNNNNSYSRSSSSRHNESDGNDGIKKRGEVKEKEKGMGEEDEEEESEEFSTPVSMTKAYETPTQVANDKDKENFIEYSVNIANRKNLKDIVTINANNDADCHYSVNNEEGTDSGHLLIIKDKCDSMSEEAFQGDFDDNMQPLTERWSPLGANYDDTMTPSSELLSPESEMELLSSDSQIEKHHQQQQQQSLMELARLRTMEDEQEMLTQSLMALTSHFAHVQLRVRQIVEAPSNERDQLLKDLEEFAFQGIPEPLNSDDVTPVSPNRCVSPSLSDHKSLESLNQQQQRQFELIDHLKSQLSDLEKMAYESGAPVLPQHILVEKQRIIIDELKSKLNLKLEEYQLPNLSTEELKNQVDSAIGEIVGPLKMKDQLVAQLKTQITDLERFIAYLQCETVDGTKSPQPSVGVSHAYNSYAAKKKASESLSSEPSKSSGTPQKKKKNRDEAKEKVVSKLNDNGASASSSRIVIIKDEVANEGQGVKESLNSKAHSLLDKASLLMQMFASTHFGSKSDSFQKNILKKTQKGNHWGDLRAQLEVDIQEVASLAATLSFDREKLYNMRRTLKKTAPPTAATSQTPPMPNSSPCSSNVIATVPRGSRHSHYKLKTYNISSDESDNDDDFNGESHDIYDNYNWKHNNNKSMLMKGDSINLLSKELTAAVRKNFSMTLLRLIQHGLRVRNESSTSSLIVPFMRCLHPSASMFNSAASASSAAGLSHSRYRDNAFLPSSSYRRSFHSADDIDDDSSQRPMHPWELILEYYYLKNGDEYNNTPARKLSESFKLDISDSQVVTAKQSLLSSIGMIINMHQPYKRSLNAHFKAFVCAALNGKHLVEWLNLILSCNELIETYYLPNSYVVRTGFRDSLRSIDALTKYDFDLPVDLAIRHFRNL